ncbi:MAG: sulfurtransferase TusA family protein [Sporichthyaceae bacterium]
MSPRPPGRAAGSEQAHPADLTVDGSGLLCVRLLLRLRATIAELPAGSVVHVIATDPAAPLDLPAWCHLTGHQYLGVLPIRQPPVHVLQVGASPRVCEPTRPWHLAGPS